MLQRVGPYEVVRELARGGMGVVYVARDPGLEREVALKVVAPTGMDAQALERFRREGRAAARLRHPNIVGVHAVGTLPGGYPYLVMDLVDGESLRARVVRDGPLPPALAARLIAQVARALDDAHGRGVLHRDLKPANILVDRAGEPHVTDFGLARLIDHTSRVTATGEIMGTPLYMAPEQADGDHTRIGPVSDVYGLGATLYELLTGTPPFHGLGGVAALHAILTRAPEPPRALRPELDPRLEAIVLRCLEKEPSRRYASAGALAQALEDALASPTAAAQARRRSPVAATIVVGLAAMIVGAAALDRDRARREAGARARAAEGGVTAAEVDARARLGAEVAATARALALERVRTEALVASEGPPAADVDERLEAAILAAADAPEVEAELRARRVLVHGRRLHEEDRRVSPAVLTRDVEALLRGDPEHPVGLLGDLVLWVMRGDAQGRAERARALDQVLEREPDLALALVFRGHRRLAERDPLGALADAERALAVDPTLAETHALRAGALLGCGRRAEAVDEALCAAALLPDRAGSWVRLVTIALGAGDVQRAREAAERALGLQEDAAALGLRARVSALEGDAAAARRDAERALALDPENGDARAALAEARLERSARSAAVEVARHGDPALAEHLLTRLLASGGGTDLDLLAWRASVRGDLERFDDARSDVDAVLVHDATHPVARLVRAQLLSRDGDPTGALSLARALVVEDDTFAEGHGLLASLLLRQGDLFGASTHVERALALDPEQGKAFAMRGGIRLYGPDFVGARADADRAIASRPLARVGWVVLAAAQLGLGELGAALQSVNQAEALDPGNLETGRLRAKVLLARGDVAGTLAVLDRLDAIAPGDADLAQVRRSALERRAAAR